MNKQIKHTAKDHKGQHTVVIARARASRKQSVTIVGLFIIIFMASSVTAAVITYNKQRNANNAAILGDISPPDDDHAEKITPLEAMPANQFFSPQLSLGSTTATLVWDLNQQKATASSPFPRNGIYRITSTMDQTNANSWKPVNTGKLGTGIELRFDAAKGEELAQWTPVGYDNGASTENILPPTAQMGQTYYFRLEIKEPSGSWKQIDNSILKIRIPYPEVKLISPPKYSANVGWTGDSTHDFFDATNPKISLFWHGTALDETAPGTYLYVSDSPDMANKQRAVTRNTVTSETFDPGTSTANASIYFVAQEPGKKKYYAVFSQSDQRLSEVTLITTQSK